MILPVYDGPGEYDRDARKAWANGRCRWHVSGNCDIRRANVGHPVVVDLLCRSRYWRMEIKAAIWEQRRGCL